MKIVSWKLVAFDEDNNEINVDVHSNDVANLIDDFLTEEATGVGVGVGADSNPSEERLCFNLNKFSLAFIVSFGISIGSEK